MSACSLPARLLPGPLLHKETFPFRIKTGDVERFARFAQALVALQIFTRSPVLPTIRQMRNNTRQVLIQPTAAALGLSVMALKLRGNDDWIVSGFLIVCFCILSFSDAPTDVRAFSISGN